MTDKDNRDQHLLWAEVDRENLVRTPVFTLVRSRRRSPTGFESDYFVVDSPDWVNIVATTEDARGRRCFIMVRQFRHGSMRVSLEFPGGVVDAGEKPERAIAREFREETGYDAGSIKLIGSVNPNPALMGNRCYTYFADSVRFVGPPAPESDEYLEVELVPVNDLVSGTRDTEFDHAMMHVALRFYRECVNGDGSV